MVLVDDVTHLTCISDIVSVLDVDTCNVYFGYFYL